MASDGGPIITDEQEKKAASILQQIVDLGATVFFEKPLTASDTSGSGRVVIPKAIAEQYFPKLEQPSGVPVRAVDIRGHEYTFKFRFWINNQSRMYLLEGAGELHRQFTMSVGDVMVFAQKTDRTLVVAGRPATKNDIIRKPPVKRPASASGEGGSGKQGKTSKETKPKAPKPSSTTTPQGQEKPKKKPKVAGSAPSPMEVEPAVDGIFRAVANVNAQPGVAAGKAGRWAVTLDLASEKYQAYFDTQEDALEAYNAAGGILPKSEGDGGGGGGDLAAAAAAAAAASDAAEAAIAAATAGDSAAPAGEDNNMEE